MRDDITTRHSLLRRWRVCGLLILMGLLWGYSASAQGISGTINNGSLWKNVFPPLGLGPPPGDGSGSGQIWVSVKTLDGTFARQVITNGVLPLAAGPYSFSFVGPFLDGAYTLEAWIDGDGNGEYDAGEPKGAVNLTINLGAPVIGKRVVITDDFDKDGLPDWWEAHWFRNEVDPLAFSGGDDPDGDGLTNLEEYHFSTLGTNGVLALLNPANWDTDGDGMDDGWECRYFDPDLLTGMNPIVPNASGDFDGDGLSDWQEYCGVDGYPRMVFDQLFDSVKKGKLNPLATVSDDLNPIDIDTDFDMLLDSFESAWYDPANRIDPRAGLLLTVPALGVPVDATIAQEDSDQDGLSNFREQCLLDNLHQSSTNGWLWNWGGKRGPFVQHTYTFQGKTYRLCTMTTCGGQALNLNLVMDRTIPDSTNRFLLRNHEWTDPTEGTGYQYADEDIAPGHDTDNDGLPDGWEVQFGLNPRDDGFGGVWDNGPFGDPDNDGLMNIDEFFGQDGNRFTTRPYINGTGDETNPNQYNWRPDSTYEWRWIYTNVTATTASSEREIGDPRIGTGINRRETLGSALPSTSLGMDSGGDSDDDGISDADEISPPNAVLPSSPVDSCDPFIARSALIISSNGIAIPDPEPEPSASSAGWRPDLQRRDWTLECHVKLLATNLTGNLFNFQTIRGPKLCTVYRLSLSNNAPVLVSDNTLFQPVMVTANPLPTNRWVHLAAVWDHKNNSLGLYVDGVLSMSPLQLTESFSVYMLAASNRLMLAESPNGSFVNQLQLDEVRIWGLARTAAQIAEFAHQLVPPVNGDDVWINKETSEYYSHNDVPIVNGGSLFDGEPGVPLNSVFTQLGSYWIDDGDGQYNALRDILLAKGSNLVEGLSGTSVANVMWNDKDHSGDYSRNSLLAYYRLDDGGSSAEDFSRRAKNGLLGATAEEFRFGDRGYALATNAFRFVTNDAAKVYGVDQRGADDSDGDGLPDAWEIIHGLDPWDDGSRGESSPGAKDGPNGAKGDPDKDGLINRYEFWAGTNPRFADSDGDGILDSQEDRDGDGVVNITEQLLGSRPDIIDTDDDGFADNEEQGMGTSPVGAVDPAISRAVILAGSKADYLEVPVNINQRLRDWTLEALVMPSNTTAGAGIIVRRVVENMGGGTQAVNFVMGLETNGVGGLQLYAGYVWPDGKQYIVRAGSAPPAVWTHLAASYSRSSAALILYVNGVEVASTNTFYVEPPVSGRGGETFVRIGEGFAGAIDEVRIWNKVRTGPQIKANTNQVISAVDNSGLIHYFRFDDGEANTNLFAWSAFHQAAGFQDFIYGNDWSAQWRHAAMKRGNVETVIPGAIIPPPSLRILLQPDDALVAGAQWSLDGGAWQNSGDTAQGLTPGTHTVMYKSLVGWTKPPSETLLLTNGVATTFTRAYVQQASVVVRFDDVTMPPGAAWRVNGGDWVAPGVVVSNLNAGPISISYKVVAGYFAPSTESVNLSPGENLPLLREYKVMLTAVSALIIPTNAVAAGAQWRVDGGAWLNSGDQAEDLPYATHVIQFSPVSRWLTPADITVLPANQALVVVTGLYSQVTISGQINNGSLWRDAIAAPPGNGDGLGAMMVGVLTASGALVDSAVVTNGALPFSPGLYAYSFGGALADGTYTVVAWIDGNGNAELDDGEPFGKGSAIIVGGNSVSKLPINLVDDSDKDGLPDWWEYHWFQHSPAPLSQGANDDPDGDGLTNLEEYRLSVDGHGFEYLNPANWDSDGDGMDDGWECSFFNTEVSTTSYGMGLNPVQDDAGSDYDGDGLANWQEYCGIDGKPNMIFDKLEDGVYKGKVASSDDLSPIDIDTDNDALFDSFEAAWYDPLNHLDPRVGASAASVTNTTIDTSIAWEDSDQDGLSNYREQCLLGQLRQSSTNGMFWNWGTEQSDKLPFIVDWYVDTKGKTRRICTMATCHGVNLNLHVSAMDNIPTIRHQLRANEWTDPTEGTGYTYEDENIPPGHDTDDDGLPDGWEVQFSLDPRDAGLLGVWDNGPFGDPDNDGLMNIDEYFGQDGDRSVTKPYVNGTWDETNPNRYNWRPDSTVAELGINRKGTLGSALPTTSIGVDWGTDSDDDGIPDAAEIFPVAGRLPSSPVDSCDPFIQRAALITSSNGIPIPVPELDVQNGLRPAGMRPDLQRRDWTLECQVKLMGTNLSGDLFNFETVYGPNACIVYRLSLSNNVPVLVSDNSDFNHVTVMANALPTNKWVHLAAVWDHANNYLSLYIDGVLSMAPLSLGESFSHYMYPATNKLALAVSANSSFVNRLMLDEVRIWGVARTAQQISDNAHRLVSPVNGDDVWIDKECPQYYSESDAVIVNGGGLFGGEPGVPLEHVCSQSGSFWIDDGDGQYNAAKDVILTSGSNLVEGLTGALVGNVLWNDKDNSGGFTRDALLAYYRFDDGGSSAEDFARHAKNGLIGATSTEYRFGDRGYALATNYFSWVTNDPALVYGVDKRGADDSDHDGLPDAWELIHHLDIWDDGTWGETSDGAKNGPNGPKGDIDHDGLINVYEYWSGTNPRAEDSDGDGILDSQEDRDGDGVVNITEQLLGSRPDIVDTDDDGFADNEEQGMGTSPVSAVDPAISRAVVFAGGAGDYLEIPANINQRLRDWTLESWVMPSSTVGGAGVIVRRVVENLAGGTQAVNFVMGLESNGVGGLRLYAGYVWPDGKQYIVKAGTIPVAAWTHVASSYSRLSATLTLYTNGAVAARTNTFYIEPPVSGKGGDTFVRMGEGFSGALDEVRLWNKVRTESQIRANTNRVIAASDTSGLINYFRFDDGEANTNKFGWSEFHQAAGFQDYTYVNDWNEEWRHAAMKRGSVVILEPGAIIPPPSMRVILQPDEALSDGAQWSLDGGAWQNSGESLEGLSAGTHILMYREILGWTQPAIETIVLSNGVATTITRVYVQQSGLGVAFNNSSAVLDLAAWAINGGVWLTNGMVVTNLNAGPTTVSYRPVTGYFTPATEVVNLIPGETMHLIRAYSNMTATLSAVITPAGAVLAGANWRVDGGPWQVSGAVVSGLPLATHQIQFSDLARWITPGTISVTPTNQVIMVVTGRYSQITGLAADLLPAEAVATGAQWRISGGGWTNSGTILSLPAGSYTVEFKPVNGGWLPPGNQTALVTDQHVTELSGIYYKAEVFGGTLTTNAGDFYLPWGLDSDALHRLYVADTFNDRIQMYDSLSQQWTVWGKFGTSLGQFKKPSGLAVDKLGNLFVADQSNHRIQKRIATNGQWVAIGSNTLLSGSALGQFSAPADVAVDSALTLYVADTWNNRVQKLSTSGVWSVFVTNGTAAGRVQYPQGLHVDGSDNLYVSDDGLQTNGLNRVQKFSKTGQFLALLGGRDSVEGSLQYPGGMTIGNGNLYVANMSDSRVAYSDMSGMTWTTLVGSNVLSHPGDVEWDSRGYLYIADTSHNRILMVQVDPAVATNGVTQLTAMTSTGTNTSFTLTWFARLNWLYAVQYANTLAPSTVWSNLPGYSAVSGMNLITNCTDSTVLGVTNRFYRIIAY
ncbi:MAG: LamG-like jellyroll fold domain-containing protein [bacterium]